MGHVYLSPEHAGKSTAALAGRGVDDAEEVVGELASRGVVFEQYDQPPIETDEKGIATFKGAPGSPTARILAATPFRYPSSAYLKALRRRPELAGDLRGAVEAG